MTTEPPKINVPAFLTNPFAFSQVLLHKVLTDGTLYVGSSTINTEFSLLRINLLSNVLTINATTIPNTYKLSTTRD